MEYLHQLISDGADEEQVCAEFESIAAELDGCLCRRIPLTLARRLSSIVPLFRTPAPDATRFGVFSVLLKLAMILAEKPEGIAALIKAASVNTAMPAINHAHTEECLCSRLDEDCAAELVESVMRFRSVQPDASTYGVFLALLSFSVGWAEKPANLKWLFNPRRGRKARAVHGMTRRPVRGV